MYIITYIIMALLLLNQPTQYQQNISSILNEADSAVVDHIHSINVLNFSQVQVVCKANETSPVAGCEYSHFDNDGTLKYSDIYIYNYETPLKGFNFNNTLAHEIGHVDWAYRMGFGSNTEGYADRYAEEKGHPK